MSIPTSSKSNNPIYLLHIQDFECDLSQETVHFTESQASNWSDDLPVTVKDINTALDIISKG